MKLEFQRRFDLTTARLLLRLTAVTCGRPDEAVARLATPARVRPAEEARLVTGRKTTTDCPVLKAAEADTLFQSATLVLLSP